MATLNIHLFGFPSVRIDSTELHFERRKTTALVAYLAVESAERAISRDALAGLFWPEGSQEQAMAYLRQSLWDFTRSAGEQWITRNGSLISLNFSAGIEVDIHEFDALFGACQQPSAEPGAMEHSLEDLTALYQGDFLAGFTLRDAPSFDEWQSLQTETYRLNLAHVLEKLAILKSAKHEWNAAIEFARRWLNLDELNEASHRALMHIYEASGQHSSALQQFEGCRSVLLKELGVEPDTETLALYRQISTGGRPEAQQPPAAAVPEQIPRRPSGTVTFVFTDIEGSTQLWEHHRPEMQHAFDRQEAIIRTAMAAHEGTIYKMIGDAFQVAFSTAPQALSAVLEAQRNLQTEDWGKIGKLNVRMALHPGVTEEREDDYVGPALNRVARLLSAGHGGQVLVSQAGYDLLRDDLPPGVTLRSLGEYLLKDLVQPDHIYQLEADGLPSRFPPLKIPEHRPVKLPAQSTPFIGREPEITSLQSALADPECRLITLTGMGGSGKTRLAIRVGELSTGFQDGVYFVPLVQAVSLEDIILSITEALGFTLRSRPGYALPVSEACEQLFQYLSGKNILLVLDNFEHLVAHSACVGELLEAVPTVKVIATSRQRLNLMGEWVIEIGGLPFPPTLKDGELEKYAAVQLFLKTAQRNSGFLPSEEDGPALLQICQMIEGVPLGLEMAAAWTRTLTCPEIAAEIRQDLDFLSASWRGMPERQRTLRAVFEYSWRLLPDAEKDAFRKLSVFGGSFDREIAFQVAGASLAILSSLSDQSFVRRAQAGRFEIHPLLRQFAHDKLGEDLQMYAATHAREAAFYTNWVSGMFENLKGKAQLRALRMMRTEAQNVFSALQWLVEQLDVPSLVKVLPAWILYHVMNDKRLEMQNQSHLFLDLVERLRPLCISENASTKPLLALALAGARYFRINYNDLATVQPLYDESSHLIDSVPDCREKAYALLMNCTGPGSPSIEESKARLQQCVDLFENIHDPWGTALAQMVSGDFYCFTHLDLERAYTDYSASLQGFIRLGCDWGRGMSLYGLMHIAHKSNHLEEAYRMGREILEIYTQMENYERLVPVHHLLAEIVEILGNIREARELYQANLAHYTQCGDENLQKFYRERIARLAPAAKEPGIPRPA